MVVPVYRVESQGEDGVLCPSLLLALAEPPRSQEAVVVREGRVVAQAHGSAWLLTGQAEEPPCDT